MKIFVEKELGLILAAIIADFVDARHPRSEEAAPRRLSAFADLASKTTAAVTTQFEPGDLVVDVQGAQALSTIVYSIANNCWPQLSTCQGWPAPWLLVFSEACWAWYEAEYRATSLEHLDALRCAAKVRGWDRFHEKLQLMIG